jgi:S1-C subfamily serine protease
MAIRNNLFISEGVMVTDLKPGSPAATGRTFGEPLLRDGDVLTALGGKPTPDVETFGTVLEEIRREKPDILLVEFQRGAFTGIEALNLKIGDETNGGVR